MQGYAKQWDKTGWQEPVYSAQTHEETKAGASDRMRTLSDANSVWGSCCVDACDALCAAVHSRLLPPFPQGFPLQSKDTSRREKRLCARSLTLSAITRMVMFSSATLSRCGLAFFETCSRADCGRGDGELDTSLTKCGRGNEQEIQVRITEGQCLSSMKHFLCTLYRRRCYQNKDEEAGSVTYGNQVGET